MAKETIDLDRKTALGTADVIYTKIPTFFTKVAFNLIRLHRYTVAVSRALDFIDHCAVDTAQSRNGGTSSITRSLPLRIAPDVHNINGLLNGVYRYNLYSLIECDTI